MKFLSFFLISLLLTGCANPYEQFYQDRMGGFDYISSGDFIVTSNKPQLFTGDDPDTDFVKMYENGFNLIGFSSFNGVENINQNLAIKKAENLHASIVLIYKKYSDTVSGTSVLTLPDTQTSTTTLFGNAYSRGGMTTYYGNIYSTSYGTKTTLIPYSVNKYDYFASYWIKRKPPPFGVLARELTKEMKKEIGSNKGAFVVAVVKDSPAYKSDILQGDIIRKIDNTDIDHPKTLSETTMKYAGKKVSVTFFRDGKELTREVLFNDK